MSTPSQGPQTISGTVSFSGLNTTAIFTAPAAGTYFVNGQLTLPQISTGASPSAVVSLVKKNGSTIYTGTAGNAGFQVTQIVLAAGDAITTVLSSAAAPDQGLNVIKGEVSF